MIFQLCETKLSVVNDQTQQEPSDDSPQVVPQLNTETLPQEKSNSWIYFSFAIVIIIITLGMIWFFASDHAKELKIDKYTAVVQMLRKNSSLSNSTQQNSPNDYFSLIPKPLLPRGNTAVSKSGFMVATLSSADLLITNSYGKQLGVKGSESLQQIANAQTQKQPIIGKEDATVPTYSLPTDLYTVLVEGKKTENISLNIFGGSNQFEIQWLPVTSGSKDLLTIDSSNRAISIKTDGERKKYGANVMIGGANGTTKNFTINNLTIANGEEEIFAVSVDGNSLEIENKAQGQSIQITAELANGEGIQKTWPIIIDRGDSVSVTPSDWNNLTSSQIIVKKGNGILY
jgi:hypothetical protein